MIITDWNGLIFGWILDSNRVLQRNTPSYSCFRLCINFVLMEFDRYRPIYLIVDMPLLVQIETHVHT